jgi:uncharacterized membrane protein YhhN
MLLTLWGMLLAASFLSFPDWHEAPRSIAWRVGSSVALVVLAWWTVWQGRGRGGARLRWGTACGMSLGCLGDAWALPPEALLPIPRLLGAMILFGAGHLAYFAAFLGPIPDEPRRLADRARFGWPSIFAVWPGVATFGWWLTASGAEVGVLRWPALGYAWLISLTGAAATWRWRMDGRWLLVAAGALLFFASDLILAWQCFRGPFPHASAWCWATYGPGQMLIVLGVRRVSLAAYR